MAITNKEAAFVLCCDLEEVEVAVDEIGVEDDAWSAENLLAAAKYLQEADPGEDEDDEDADDTE